MQMNKVKSSQIEEVGYDAATQMLRVRFKGGALYEYEAVPPEVGQPFLSAESLGSHFYKNIRNAGFKYKKLDEQGEQGGQP